MNSRSRIEHSVQFDILSHLSSAKCPQHHIVVGWTGEISSPDATHSHADDPSPWSSNDANTLAQPRDNLFVSCHNQQVLDQQLANAEMVTAPVWMASSRDLVRKGINLGDQAR